MEDKTVWCPKCGGSGADEYPSLGICSFCAGIGTMTPEQIQQQEESELIWDVIDSAYHKEYEIFEKLQERKGLQEWEVQVLYLQRDYLQTCVEWFKGLDRDVQIEVAKANGTDIDQAYVDWHLTNA